MRIILGIPKATTTGFDRKDVVMQHLPRIGDVILDGGTKYCVTNVVHRLGSVRTPIVFVDEGLALGVSHDYLRIDP